MNNAWLGQEIAPATPEFNTPDRKDQKRQQAASRQGTANTRKPLEQKLAKLETEMKTLTTERDKIVQWLATEEAYLEGSKPRLQEMLKRQGEVVTLLADVEWKWFNCAAEAGSGWLSNILMLG